MFKKIKEFFGGKPELLVVKPSSMSREDAERIAKEAGRVLVYAEDEAAVKIEKAPEEGDGKAVFIGEPTQAEELDFKREQEGTLPWYKRILRDEKDSYEENNE